MKNKRNVSKNYKYFGFIGFLGFGGFGYLINKDISNLFMFSFFSYFSYFIIHKLAKEMPDERFLENSAKARSKALIIPFITLFVIGFFATYSFMTKEIIILISAIGWSATILIYAFMFTYYEKH